MEVATASEYNCDLRQLSMLFVAQQNTASEAMGSGGSETMRISGATTGSPKPWPALGTRL